MSNNRKRAHQRARAIVFYKKRAHLQNLLRNLKESFSTMGMALRKVAETTLFVFTKVVQLAFEEREVNRRANHERET